MGREKGGKLARVEARLEEMGIVLPEPVKAPPGVRVPFARARVRGDRAYVSGHAVLNEDGSPAGPFGKVGAEVSPEEAHAAAAGRASRFSPARSASSATWIG